MEEVSDYGWMKSVARMDESQWLWMNEGQWLGMDEGQRLELMKVSGQEWMEVYS